MPTGCVSLHKPKFQSIQLNDNMTTDVLIRVREAVATFDDVEQLEKAVFDLRTAGFEHRQMSLIANESTVKEKLGSRCEHVAELTDDPGVPRSAFVERAVVREGKAALIGALSYIGAVGAAGAIAASGGTLAVVAGGALALGTAGAAVGAALAEYLGHEQAASLNAQIEKGGILLWVNVPDEASEAKALAALRPLSKSTVYIHDIALSQGD